jgi:hypothetical protein
MSLVISKRLGGKIKGGLKTSLNEKKSKHNSRSGYECGGDLIPCGVAGKQLSLILSRSVGRASRIAPRPHPPRGDIRRLLDCNGSDGRQRPNSLHTLLARSERVHPVRVGALYTSVGSIANGQLVVAQSPFSTPSRPICKFLCRTCRSLEPIARARDCETLACHALLDSTPSRTKRPEPSSFLHQTVGMTRSLFHGCQAAGGVGAEGLEIGSTQNKGSAQSYGWNALRECDAAALALLVGHQEGGRPPTCV